MNFEIIFPLTYLLDDVIFKSSIDDVCNLISSEYKGNKNWILFSDYYFETEKKNRVITFSLIPAFENVFDISEYIKEAAPKEIKHTKFKSDDFINILNNNTFINFCFTFEINNKYFSFYLKN